MSRLLRLSATRVNVLAAGDIEDLSEDGGLLVETASPLEHLADVPVRAAAVRDALPWRGVRAA